MPQSAAWAAIKSFVSWLVSAKTVGAFVARLVVMSAISYGLGKLMARRPNSGLTGSNPLDLRIDSMAPHRIIYGETAVGPVLRFRHATGTDNQYAYLILIWAAHECEAITAFKADGQTITFDGSGNAIGTYAGVLRVTHHLGAHDQTADANFVSELGSLWTTNHRLRGRCYSAVRLTWDPNKWPSGIPHFTAVVKGRKVYDWRDEDQDINDYTTWKWSDNPALCTADFLRGVPMLNGAGELVRPYGIACEDAALPAAKWIAEANACDESVELADGGTEKRYTCNGCFDVDTSPPLVLDALAASMAGKVVPMGAEFIPFAGVWHAPDFTVDETMLRGEPTATNPLPRTERINTVKGTYNDPTANYQKNDFPQVVSDAFIEEDGGELARDLDLAFTNSPTMAQRIAKIGLLRSRQGLVTGWPCNLRAVPAMTGENVAIDSGEFGWDGKVFEVTEFTLAIQRGDDGGLGFAPDIVFQETDPSIFDWDTDEENTTDPAPNTGGADPRDVPVPADVALTNAATIQPDGTVVPRVRVAWTLPADAWVRFGGYAHLEYRKSGDTDWLVWARLRGDAALDYITDVRIGETMELRMRFQNSYGVYGAFCDTESIVVGGDETAPDAPSGLAASTVPGAVALNWLPNSEPDLAGYRLYRRLASEADDIDGAVLVWSGSGTAWQDTSAEVGTLYRYWLRAFDGSGNVSAVSAATTGSAGDAAPPQASAPVIDFTPNVLNPSVSVRPASS